MGGEVGPFEKGEKSRLAVGVEQRRGLCRAGHSGRQARGREGPVVSLRTLECHWIFPGRLLAEEERDSP